MLRDKKIKLKLESNIKTWSYVNFLRQNGILIICENLQSIKKELKWHQYIGDNHYKFRNLLKNLNLNLNSLNKWIKFEYINNFLIINNWDEFLEIYKILENKNIEIIGYYLNNILFSKKDLNLKLINKKVINEKLLEKYEVYTLCFFNLLFILKKNIVKVNNC